MRAMKATALLLVFALASGCATAVNDTRKGIVGALHVLNATTDIVETIDKAKVDAAVAKAQAGDVDGAKADLAKWDAQFEKIKAATTVLWDALRLAADGLSAYETGSKDKDPIKLLGSVLGAVADLTQLLADLGIQLPGGLQ